MTEFRKELNKLLKEKAISDIVERHENGAITFKEAIWEVAERIQLEEDAFWAVRNDEFTMIGMTDTEVNKKIKNTDTGELRKYMEWKRRA